MTGRAWETAVAERTFVWQRMTPLKDWYELRAAGRTLARLGIGGLHFTKARLESDDLHLVFTTEGVGERWVRIADVNGEHVVANFERRWSGWTGTLQLATGGQLEWRRVGWRRRGYVFTDRFANPLLCFDPAGGVTGYGLGTELEPLIGSWRDLVVLLALGWFLLIVAGAADPPTAAYGSTPSFHYEMVDQGSGGQDPSGTRRRRHSSTTMAWWTRTVRR